MELSKRIANLKPSITLEITAKANAMKKQGIDVIGFGAGEPDFDTPEHIKEAAIKAIKEGKTKYTPAAGIPELREAVAELFTQDYGVKFSMEEVIISCGGKHSLYNIFQVILNKDDEVIIPSPYWVSYPAMVELAGGKPVIIPSSIENNFQIDLNILKKLITSKTKAIILNSPSNPTGILYSKETLQGIINLIKDKEIFIISDDIYNKLVYDENFINVLMIDNSIKEKTIIVNGVSKTYSMTGWRIGFTGANKEIISAINKIQSQSTSNPTSIAQYAALEAITGDQNCVEEMKNIFKKRRDIAVEMLNQIPGLKFLKPQGAFYLFPDISTYIKKSEFKNDIDFSKALLEKEKVAIIPGSGFGVENTFRISFALSENNIRKGIERIKNFIS